MSNEAIELQELKPCNTKEESNLVPDTESDQLDAKVQLSIALDAITSNVLLQLPEHLGLSLAVLGDAVFGLCSSTCCKEHALNVFDLFIERLSASREALGE